MPTNNSRSTLINDFVSAWNRREELRNQTGKVNDELRKITDQILGDNALVKVLTDTGVRVGNDKLMDYDPDNTVEALVVIDQPDPPFAFQLDEVIDDE